MLEMRAVLAAASMCALFVEWRSGLNFMNL